MMEDSYETKKIMAIVDKSAESAWLKFWADLISRANKDALTFFGADGDEV